MTRRTLALFVLAAVVVSSLATWFASSQFHSPAEIAARTAPPEPSPILVPVEQRVLANKVVSRGTAHYGSPHELSVTPSGLKTGPQVITTLPRAGQVVEEASVLLTVSGRPTFVMVGPQPSYRDLGPGMSGQDVTQLEKALSRSGFAPGVVDGRFDRATGDAVARLYRQSGYAPVVATESQLAAARPREAQLVDGARARGGTQLPADEVIFVPSTPVRVNKVNAAVGAASRGPLVTVTSSLVAVDGALPVEQAGLFTSGAKVLIDEPDLGIKATGTVSRVAAQPGTDGTDGFHVFFQVAVDNPPAALVGASVRLTVPVRSTKEAQLTVPVSAVSLGADGGSRVQRSVDGTISAVAVDPGLSADGYVAIKVAPGALAAGDLVVVGFEEIGVTRD